MFVQFLFLNPLNNLFGCSITWMDYNILIYLLLSFQRCYRLRLVFRNSFSFLISVVSVLSIVLLFVFKVTIFSFISCLLFLISITSFLLFSMIFFRLLFLKIFLFAIRSFIFFFVIVVVLWLSMIPILILLLSLFLSFSSHLSFFFTDDIDSNFKPILLFYFLFDEIYKALFCEQIHNETVGTIFFQSQLLFLFFFFQNFDFIFICKIDNFYSCFFLILLSNIISKQLFVSEEFFVLLPFRFWTLFLLFLILDSLRWFVLSYTFICFIFNFWILLLLGHCCGFFFRTAFVPSNPRVIT